jgi:hypothetical protein
MQLESVHVSRSLALSDSYVISLKAMNFVATIYNIRVGKQGNIDQSSASIQAFESISTFQKSDLDSVSLKDIIFMSNEFLMKPKRNKRLSLIHTPQSNRY